MPLPSDVRSRVRFCDWVDDIRRFPKSYRRPPTRVGGRGLFFGGSGAGRIRKEACDLIWAIQKVCFYVRSSLVWTFGGMLHTPLRHLGCTQPPIHAGKSMLCGAELSVGVEGVFLASTVSPQRGWGGGVLCEIRVTGRF